MLFVPFVNALLMFTWLYNYAMSRRDVKIFMKALIISYLYVLPFVLVWSLLRGVLGETQLLQIINEVIMFYGCPLLWGIGLIRTQKNFIPK